MRRSFTTLVDASKRATENDIQAAWDKRGKSGNADPSDNHPVIDPVVTETFLRDVRAHLSSRPLRSGRGCLAKSALLMIDTGPQFQQFMESIELTQTQVDRIESARKSLSSELEKAFGLGGDEVFAQGSFANGTAARPVEGGQYDVDIVAATAKEEDTAADAIGNLYEALADTRYKEMIEERKPCVRVTYADDYIGGFHVDVVPVRVSSGDTGAPHEAPRKGSGWHPTAPSEYTAWCANGGEDFRRTVRMFKRWRDEQQDVRKAVKFYRAPGVGIRLYANGSR